MNGRGAKNEKEGVRREPGGQGGVQGAALAFQSPLEGSRATLLPALSLFPQLSWAALGAATACLQAVQLLTCRGCPTTLAE